ncbi:MAG: cytochrome b [Anaerolineae bacterium]|nr:cytochrome b [Gloeobacterales cyanobacterium ES-bin-313]
MTVASARKEARNYLWVVHWVMATAYVIIFSVGLYMVNLPEKSPLASPLYSFHESMGVLVMLLLTGRIFLTLRALAPVKPKNWIVTATIHTLLYTLMVIVPLSGYFHSNLNGYSVEFFGLPTPTLAQKNKPVAEATDELHQWLAYTFAAFVGIHLISQRKWIAGNIKKVTRRFSSAA